MTYINLIAGAILLVLIQNAVHTTAVATDPTQFSCNLDSHMTLSWFISNDIAHTTVSLDSTQNWVSFGAVQPYQQMVPSNTIHSVFVYAPTTPFANRFYMASKDSGGFSIDSRPRLNTGLVTYYQATGKSFLVVNYSSGQTYSDDANINLASSNYVTWAYGGVWPAAHSKTARGFIQVHWTTGVCSKGLLASPYLIFLMIVAVLLSRVFRNFKSIDHLAKKQIMYSNGSIIDVGDFIILLIHSGIALAVFLTYVIDSGYALSGYVTATGNVAILHFWVALWPASKSTVMLWITGVPFERLVKYHKMCATTAVVCSIIHGGINAAANPTIYFSTTSTGKVVPLYGALALFVFFFMAIFAQWPVRRWSYELFHRIHHLYPVGIAFLILHSPAYAYGFIPGLLLLGSRYILLVILFYSNVYLVADIAFKVYAWFTPCPLRSVRKWPTITELAIANSSPNTPESLGSYYYILVREASLVQWHPISVAFSNKDSIYFYIKSLGNNSWSERVAKAVESENTNITVSLLGPYGRLALDLGLYTSVHMIAGGIGITPFLNMLKVLCIDQSFKNVHTAVLHWSLRDVDVYEALKEKLEAILVNQQQVKIQIKLYLTSKASILSRLSNIDIITGRMNIHEIVTSIDVNATSSTCFLACGPPAMTHEVNRETRATGIDCHLETFMY